MSVLRAVAWRGPTRARSARFSRLVVRSSAAARWSDDAGGASSSWSPTDLVLYSKSPFAAWMDHLARTPLRPPSADGGARERAIAHARAALLERADAPDPFLLVLARQGLAAERRALASLRARGATVVDLSGAREPTLTREAIASGADVIYQAPLADAGGGGARGIADFLLRVDGRARGGGEGEGGAALYAVGDAKLARAPTPAHALQLCCYAEMLAPLQGGRHAAGARLLLGGGPHGGADCPARLELAQHMAYYRRLRARFEAFRAQFDPADALELHALLQRGDEAAQTAAAAAGVPAGPPPWPRGVPDPVAGGNDAARWAGLARSLLGARDDLSLVARLSRAQRARLHAAGVATRTALAALPASTSEAPQGAHDDRRRAFAVTGIAAPALARLQRQAALQLAHEQASRAARAMAARPPAPPFELVRGACGAGALGALPPPSAGDVYFDLEGDPFGGAPPPRAARSHEEREASLDGTPPLFGVERTVEDYVSSVTPPTAADDGRNGARDAAGGGARGGGAAVVGGIDDEVRGLEYLWGAATDDSFEHWWAHDAAGETAALAGFVGWVFARLEVHPGLHIYHYGHYEEAALKRLAARSGDRALEARVDALLRRGVLVDLYKIVSRSLLVGEPSYSIKNVEKLYRAPRGLDDGGVAAADQSIVWYHRWIEAQDAASGIGGHGDGGDEDEHGADEVSSDLLRDILVYNRDDCESTRELVAWLRALRAERCVAAARGPTARAPLPHGAYAGDDGEWIVPASAPAGAASAPLSRRNAPFVADARPAAAGDRADGTRPWLAVGASDDAEAVAEAIAAPDGAGAPEAASADAVPPLDAEAARLHDELVGSLDDAWAPASALAERGARELLAGMLDYHRRENKPVWWRRFEWRDASVTELIDDERTLGGLRRTATPPRAASARARTRRVLEFSFDGRQMTKLAVGDAVVVVGLTPSPADVAMGGPAGELRAKIAALDAQRGRVELEMSAEPSPRDERAGVGVAPDEFVNPAPIPAALVTAASSLVARSRADAHGSEGGGCLDDFVARRAPRFARARAAQLSGAVASTGDGALAEAVDAVLSLDDSYLIIQGPPGTGKTHAAAHIIARLLRNGHTVGVLANAHDAITLVLERALTAFVEEERLGEGDGAAPAAAASPRVRAYKVGGRPTQGERVRTALARAAGGADAVARVVAFEQCRSMSVALRKGGGDSDGGHGIAVLVGATAWGFASDGTPDAVFDYLFVDEAGQVPAANIVACARAASRVVLMGDQMQLAAPTEGSHPAGAGVSCLEHALGGAHVTVVPHERGVFLPATRRLHPRVCAPISELVYDGQLAPHSSAATRALVLPPLVSVIGGAGHSDARSAASAASTAPDASASRVAGIVPVVVESAARGQRNDAEVAAVRALCDELVGRASFVDDAAAGAGARDRTLSWDDVLVVAPFRAQARALEDALGARARVGTVDAFQGQEAPVVIISLVLTADTGAERDDTAYDGAGGAGAAGPAPPARGDGGGAGSATARALSFVLNRNRLNVALSRAQVVAFVVVSATLAEAAAPTLRTMRELNMLCRLLELPVDEPLAQLAARAAVAARGSHHAEPPVKALSPEAPVKALTLSGSRSEGAGAGAPVRPTSSGPGLQALRVPELREACRRRGLRVSGRKAELVERLGAANSPD